MATPSVRSGHLRAQAHVQGLYRKQQSCLHRPPMLTGLSHERDLSIWVPPPISSRSGQQRGAMYEWCQLPAERLFQTWWRRECRLPGRQGRGAA